MQPSCLYNTKTNLMKQSIFHRKNMKISLTINKVCFCSLLRKNGLVYICVGCPLSNIFLLQQPFSMIAFKQQHFSFFIYLFLISSTLGRYCSLNLVYTTHTNFQSTSRAPRMLIFGMQPYFNPPQLIHEEKDRVLSRSPQSEY